MNLPPEATAIEASALEVNNATKLLKYCCCKKRYSQLVHL